MLFVKVDNVERVNTLLFNKNLGPRTNVELSIEPNSKPQPNQELLVVNFVVYKHKLMLALILRVNYYTDD